MKEKIAVHVVNRCLNIKEVSGKRFSPQNDFVFFFRPSIC